MNHERFCLIDFKGNGMVDLGGIKHEGFFLIDFKGHGVVDLPQLFSKFDLLTGSSIRIPTPQKK